MLSTPFLLPTSVDIQLIRGRTELGHGSNVRGIECQAFWDQKTQEFVLHSPTLTASKWWNGTMGRTANHAIGIGFIGIA